MSNAELRIFDGNTWYWVYFKDSRHNAVGRCLAIAIENTDQCREDMKVPEETTFIIEEKDVKYLLSYLKTFLNDTESL